MDLDEPGRGLGPLEVAAGPVDALGDPGQQHLGGSGVHGSSSSVSGVVMGGRGDAFDASVGVDGGVDDPGVLAAAALGAVDDERALAQRDPGQPALGDVRVVAGEDERAQVEVAGHDLAVAQRRAVDESSRIGWAT